MMSRSLNDQTDISHLLTTPFLIWRALTGEIITAGPSNTTDSSESDSSGSMIGVGGTGGAMGAVLWPAAGAALCWGILWGGGRSRSGHVRARERWWGGV